MNTTDAPRSTPSSTDLLAIPDLATPDLLGSSASATPTLRRRAVSRAVVALALTLLVSLAMTGNALAASAPSQTTVQISPVDLAQEDTVQTVTVTVTNSSRAAMTRANVSLRGPAGWTVGPQSIEIRRIDAGERAHAVFDVRVPTLRDGFRMYPFTATITYNGGDGLGTATQERVLTSGEPVGSIAAARNNVGITTLPSVAEGNFDGDGNSFSAEALEAVDVTPGATIEGAGTQFTWPDVAAGEPDNVTANGQAIEVGTVGRQIGFLASGSGLNAMGTLTVYYTDGSSSEGTRGVPNWTGVGANPEAEVVAAAKGRNTPDGYGNENGTYSVFATAVEIDPSKTVDFVVLPGNSSIHVFDMVVS
ncbi:NEW3 domain-containing protein [Brachybacterium tyrofermentans]|uniref:NEW3 domain-containing protein n=1 Tax=Brachybacterium tyrofermentans TaxID=47848 RepID=UPI003FD3E10E